MMSAETNDSTDQNQVPPIKEKCQDTNRGPTVFENWPIASENWPSPKWIHPKVNSIHHADYNDYLATNLRARYSEIETYFRSVYPEYLQVRKDKLEDVKATSEQLVRLLSHARIILEKGLSEDGNKTDKNDYLGKQDLFLATNLLNLADECMAWIYPEDIVLTQIPILIARIEETKNLEDKDKQRYIKQLNDQLDKKDEKAFRQVFDEIIWLCNKKNLEEMINIGLQIECLVNYVKWGRKLLLIFFLVIPLMINFKIFSDWSLYGDTTIYGTINATAKQAVSNWIMGGWHTGNLTIGNWKGSLPIPSWHMGNFMVYWQQAIIVWLTALGIAIVGGIGGYLSGLIQTRRSKTSLALYEEGVLLSQLRLIFGGFAGLVSFVLLSWNLLSGISVTSLGPIVLAAFLSGFSERYFLNLLKIEQENGQEGQLHKDNSNKDNADRDTVNKDNSNK
jgi:hypothetical protein